MNTHKFEMDSKVKLITSEESGTVIGRSEFRHSENSYLVLYCAADGRQTECWWSESTIEQA